MTGSHLAILVSEHQIQFISIYNKVVRDSHEFDFDSSSDLDNREQVSNELSKISFIENDFDEVTLSWSTNRSTLVPNIIFSDSDPVSIFELCYGKDSSKHSIDYNRIAELSIINVYEIPDWIKRLFVIKFPRIVIQHEGTHVLRQVMHSSAFYLKATVVLYQGYFQLTLVKHNNLEFYSYFDYQSSEDVLYHLMFTLQQKEFTNEDGILEIVNHRSQDTSIASELTSQISRVQELSKLTLETPENFISKAHLLCV